MSAWRLFARTSGAGALADLTQLRPVSPGRALTNKAGRIVLRAQQGRQQLKVYEAANTGHAGFIASASAALPDLFPTIVDLRGAWVLADWVEGEAMHDARAAVVALRRIHAHATCDLPSPDFDYWADFIVPRFLRAASLAGQGTQASDMVAHVNAACAGRPRVLSHADLTPDNLVQGPQGLRSIDNELLGLTALPALDALNAARPLKGRDARAFREGWGKCDTPRDVLAQAWIARQTGSAMIAGDWGLVARLLMLATQDPVSALPEGWHA
jgi:hypothetical protein